MPMPPPSLRRRFSLSLSALCLAALLGGCASSGGPGSAAPSAAKPRLVLLLVVDGLPQRQVLAYRDQLAEDGLRRFLDRGAWFANAHYGHGHTVTAAGHAVMLTGAHPQRSGIIGNEWRDPLSGEPVYCTSDSAHQYIGHTTAPLAGTSPRNLKVEALGDVLRGRQPEAKVIGISGKDRGAILPAGHKGQAYMYMGSSGQFASSSYYMQQHPAWVERFNAARPADAFFKKSWTPLLPEASYARSVPDGQPWQYSGGNGNRLPAVIGAGMDAPGPRYYGNLIASPFSDQLTLDFARAAIAGENLGADDIPDILSVSLSGHDYVNHAFGPESRLSHDHLLHLDRHLQAFFRDLDARLGADNYVAVLSADHGFADTPEWARSQGRDADRINPSQTLAWLETELSKQFGEGRWTRGYSASGLLFNDALITAKGLQPTQVHAAAKQLLLQVDGVAAVFTREQLESDDAHTPWLAQMRRSWHPEVAAPLQIVVKENWLYSSRGGGSSHGTPYAYDSHVPIMAWGPRWVGRGEVQARVGVVDIAPTLAGLLQIPAPAQSQGRPLPLPQPLPR